MTRFSSRYALVVALFGAFLLRAPAYADSAATPSPSPSASPAGLRPIGEVVTNDRRPEPIGLTSQPTFVIDRAHIEAFGDRTVDDALRDVPGVELFSYGAFGAQTTYGIRGASSAQTLVLVDGIPVTDPTTGTIEISQFSTVGVKRIEVVESGSSTLYGTSASGGVINIITQVPRGAYLAGSLGSFDDRDVRATVGDGTVGFDFERHVATNAYPYGPLNYGPRRRIPAASVRTPRAMRRRGGSRSMFRRSRASRCARVPMPRRPTSALPGRSDRTHRKRRRKRRRPIPCSSISSARQRRIP